MSPERRRALIKKRKRQRRIRCFVILLFLLLFVGVAWGVVYLKSTVGQMKRTEIDDSNLQISDKFDKNSANYSDSFSEITNIAIYGVDEKVDDIQRSDTIMVGTIDTKHNKLKISSFMRDSYVNIPGHGYDKLTHAYADGGPELSIATINKNFDLNITDYVAVDFTRLEKIIDALGGVEIDLTDQDIRDLNDYMAIVYNFYNEPIKLVERSSDGLVHLNGFEAVGYGRNRSTPGADFDRTQRQRNLMNAMFQKVSKMGTAKLATLIPKLMPYVETSLTNSEIVTLATKVLSMNSMELEQCRFPMDDNALDSYINGTYYMTFDEDITRNQIYEYLFNDVKVWEPQDSTNDSEYNNSEYIDSNPSAQ